MSNENVISSRIKELRTGLNLTQSQFADSLNISTVSISSYETGAKTPSLDMIINIARKYNISLDWLCGLSDIKSLSHNIDTYSDLFKIFLKFHQTRYKDDDSSLIDGFSHSSKTVILRFSDPSDRIQTFVEEWSKMVHLYIEKTIDHELYTLWLDKKLNDVYDIPLDTRPDFMLVDTDSTTE